MPGDELHEEATGPARTVPGAGRERTGPRHAAPKKPFLTRLHVPAGKAVAMAAMPSAVLLSMGITPQLAYAKPLPKNPFGDGPCISQQDKAEEEARKEAEAEQEAAAERKRAEAERKAAEKEKQEAAEQEAAEEEAAEQEAAEEEQPSGSSGDESTDTSGGTGDTGAGSTEPEPEPSPSGEEDSGDGLLGGVLGGLGDALGGGGGEKEPSDAQAEPEPSDTPEAAAKDSSDPVGDTVDEVGKGLEDTVDKVEEGVEATTGELPLPDPSASDGGSDQDGSDQDGADVTDPVTGEDGKRAFPCVEEKKVAGEDEQTPATLPNQPWVLKASSLAIHGQNYEGVVNVRTANGETKQVLKFTADSIDIGDLHQITQGPNGLKYHVKAAPGSTSTIRDSQVTLYTERLEGKLFGLIPIVFDPEHPPPLNISEVYFTDVTVTQAGQFGGTLTVPGLTSTISDG